MAKKVEFKFVTMVKRADGGYDEFYSLPEEERRRVLETADKKAVTLAAKSLGYDAVFTLPAEKGTA